MGFLTAKAVPNVYKEGRGRQKARVASLAFSRPKLTNLVFFKTVGLETFENLLSSWPFLKSRLI